MRLIDADELEKVMTEDWFLDILLTQNGKSEIANKLVNMIDSVPLAYDVEKVVAELEKLKQHNKELSKNAYLKDDESFYFCAYTNFARAIGIVRKGGAE